MVMSCQQLPLLDVKHFQHVDSIHLNITSRDLELEFQSCFDANETSDKQRLTESVSSSYVYHYEILFSQSELLEQTLPTPRDAWMERKNAQLRAGLSSTFVSSLTMSRHSGASAVASRNTWVIESRRRNEEIASCSSYLWQVICACRLLSTAELRVPSGCTERKLRLSDVSYGGGPEIAVGGAHLTGCRCGLHAENDAQFA